MKNTFFSLLIFVSSIVFGMQHNYEHQVRPPRQSLGLGFHNTPNLVHSQRRQLQVAKQVTHTHAPRSRINQSALYWVKLQKTGNLPDLKAQLERLKHDQVKASASKVQKFEKKIVLLERIVHHPVTIFLHRIKTGSRTEALEAYQALLKQCPFYSEGIITSCREIEYLECTRQHRTQELGFDEVVEAKNLFQVVHGSLPELVATPVVDSKSKADAVAKPGSPPLSPRSAGQDFVSTTPSDPALIPPELHTLVEERLSQLDGAEFVNIEEHSQAVAAILSSVNQKLILSDRQNLLARGIKTYCKRLLNPLDIVADQIHFFVNATHFVCDMTIGQLYLDPDVIMQRQQELKDALSALSLENLSKIPAEHWADLIATIAADITFGAGVSKTITFLKDIDAVGRASGKCAKVARDIEKRVSQVGIKIAKKVEQKIAQAALEGKEVVTIDGIVLKVPQQMGDASVLKSSSDKVLGGAASVAKRITTKRAEAIARKLGFVKTNYYSHGKSVFKKGSKFITIDVDSHCGGVWKMADSVKRLGSKKTRMGTYDQFLNRIGD